MAKTYPCLRADSSCRNRKATRHKESGVLEKSSAWEAMTRERYNHTPDRYMAGVHGLGLYLVGVGWIPSRACYALIGGTGRYADWYKRAKETLVELRHRDGERFEEQTYDEQHLLHPDDYQRLLRRSRAPLAGSLRAELGLLPFPVSKRMLADERTSESRQVLQEAIEIALRLVPWVSDSPNLPHARLVGQKASGVLADVRRRVGLCAGAFAVDGDLYLPHKVVEMVNEETGEAEQSIRWDRRTWVRTSPYRDIIQQWKRNTANAADFGF